jgi:hypothetical protein
VIFPCGISLCVGPRIPIRYRVGKKDDCVLDTLVECKGKEVVKGCGETINEKEGDWLMDHRFIM